MQPALWYGHLPHCEIPTCVILYNLILLKVAEHNFQVPMPNSPLLLNYLCIGARFLQESRLTTEGFILTFIVNGLNLGVSVVCLLWTSGWGLCSSFQSKYCMNCLKFQFFNFFKILSAFWMFIKEQWFRSAIMILISVTSVKTSLNLDQSWNLTR